jgi:glyoxylase-like metal-dependent hydrolase (beta-lactamase superfamily II)
MTATTPSRSRQALSVYEASVRSIALATVTQLTPGTRQISLLFQGEPGIIGSYLLEGGNELAIIDPGPGSTIEDLLAALREAGFEPQDVTHILATHIHLDHAGAVGSLVRLMPRATVYVHSKGVPHLLDTTKVVASATRIYGERMQELWGDIEPTPQERLKTIEGGDILTIAGRRMEVHYTPGHAVHHVIFFDVHSGELFAGDSAGVRLQGLDYIRPPTPPPDIDLEAWSSSIDLLKRLRPDVLYLAHFGPSQNTIQHLERLREQLYSWGDFVLGAMREGKEEDEIIQLLAARGETELKRATRDERESRRYEIAANYAMSVQGYMRYWKLKSQKR